MCDDAEHLKLNPVSVSSPYLQQRGQDHEQINIMRMGAHVAHDDPAGGGKRGRRGAVQSLPEQHPDPRDSLEARGDSRRRALVAANWFDQTLVESVRHHNDVAVVGFDSFPQGRGRDHDAIGLAEQEVERSEVVRRWAASLCSRPQDPAGCRQSSKSAALRRNAHRPPDARPALAIRPGAITDPRSPHPRPDQHTPARRSSPGCPVWQGA